MSDKQKNTVVLTTEGKIPYSIGYMAQALIAIGLPQDRAYRDAYSLSLYVNKMDKDEISSDEIMELTAEWYAERDPKYTKRIAHLKTKYKAFRPTVFLLGGVTGIGKSTLAELLGSIFGIRTILGTDLLREVLRVTISPDLLPTLHTSSYMAHEKLDTSFLPAKSETVIGFEAQARSVAVSIESAIEQAIQDDEIVIIEGVHLVPGILKKNLVENDTVIFIMLSLQNEDTHRSRLTIRESRVESRSEQYLAHFENIRKIQEYLLDQAEHNNVEIVDIERNEDALNLIINMIWDWKLDQLEEEEDKEAS